LEVVLLEDGRRLIADVGKLSGAHSEGQGFPESPKMPDERITEVRGVKNTSFVGHGDLLLQRGEEGIQKLQRVVVHKRIGCGLFAIRTKAFTLLLPFSAPQHQAQRPRRFSSY